MSGHYVVLHELYANSLSAGFEKRERCILIGDVIGMTKEWTMWSVGARSLVKPQGLKTLDDEVGIYVTETFDEICNALDARRCS